jgi:hypothetical protein
MLDAEQCHALEEDAKTLVRLDESKEEDERTSVAEAEPRARVGASGRISDATGTPGATTCNRSRPRPPRVHRARIFIV